jgi:hypothetical protein
MRQDKASFSPKQIEANRAEYRRRKKIILRWLVENRPKKNNARFVMYWYRKMIFVPYHNFASLDFPAKYTARKRKPVAEYLRKGEKKSVSQIDFWKVRRQQLQSLYDLIIEQRLDLNAVEEATRRLIAEVLMHSRTPNKFTFVENGVKCYRYEIGDIPEILRLPFAPIKSTDMRTGYVSALRQIESQLDGTVNAKRAAITRLLDALGVPATKKETGRRLRGER